MWLMFKFIKMLCQANIYLFKDNNRNTRKRCEKRSKLTIENQNDVNEVMVFLLLNLNIFHTYF